jgi:hypothetical protein
MAEFNYNISVTGDCSNNGSGAIELSLFGGTPPYTVQWQSPLTQTNVVTIEPSVVTGLNASTYNVRVNDSTLPTNLEFFINIPVSNGVCATILNVQNTTCNFFNGSVTGTSSSQYSSTNFYLLGINDSVVQSATTNTSEIVFAGLSAGTYYIIAEDLGGCTGATQSFIIDTSEEFNFGLYVVPNSSCGGIPIGKIIVTGETGQAQLQD